MKLFVTFLFALFLHSNSVLSDSHLTGNSGLFVWAMCGPSKGQGYFFKDSIMNPNGPSWEADAISNGQITLVESADQFDIIFGDAYRASGYREDGAQVILLQATDKYLRVGAFADSYADIYNFDRENLEVAWSSNKSGPFSGKVAVYVSKCTFIK